MSELASEMAGHAQPERVKELAAEKVSAWKERAKELATEKAGELKEQAKEAAVEKATEIKTRAKEAVMSRTMELKAQADSPRGWSLLGAIIGAGVGAILMKKAFVRREERYAMGGQMDIGVSGGIETRADVGTSSGAELKERASDVAQSVKDKAYDLKDRAWGAVEQARDRGSHLRERLPSASDVKGRASHWFDQALDRQPLMLALGSIALGLFASLLIPVSRRERQLIEPARRKAQEGISHLGDQLEQKLEDTRRSEGSNIPRSGIEPTDRSELLATPTASPVPPLPPLDDVSKLH